MKELLIQIFFYFKKFSKFNQTIFLSLSIIPVMLNANEGSVPISLIFGRRGSSVIKHL